MENKINKMKTYYLVYSCGAWHSHSSKKVIGVFTTRNNAMKGIENHSNYTLTKDDKDNLERINQTQGKNINYMIELIVLNCML